MVEINKKIIDMINRNLSTNEIINELNITKKQLYKRLSNIRNYGINLIESYNTNGEIIYSCDKNLTDKQNDINLINLENEFKIMLISDTHIGCRMQNIKALDAIYNYCVNNDIHIIVNAGDIVDGINFNHTSKYHDNHISQAEYAIKKYPYDDSILNFVCLGNHDIDSLKSIGFDFAKFIENIREDIIILGYGKGFINIGNDRIEVIHPLKNNKNYYSIDSKITVQGHRHKMVVDVLDNGYANIFIPTLSNVFINKDDIMYPSAIKMTISMSNRNFSGIFLEQLIYINNSYMKVNEYKLKFEEQNKNQKVLSQVDKFHKRYGQKV